MTLYAKPLEKVPITLLDHTNSVREAGDLLIDIFGDDMIRFWGFQNLTRERLKYLLNSAIWLHDLGKSNNHFQNYMTNPVGLWGDGRPRLCHFQNPQPIRHETVSLWLATQEFIRSKLESEFSGEERRAILSAVASHHSVVFDPGRRSKIVAEKPFRGTAEVIVDTSSEGFREMIADCPFRNPEEMTESGKLKFSVSSRFSDFRSILPLYRRQAFEFDNQIDWANRYQSGPSKHEVHLVGFLKSCLIVSDIIGSIANDREAQNKPTKIYQYIREWGNKVEQRHDHTKRVEQDVREIETKHRKIYQPNRFQTRCAESTFRVTLLLQGCGSGKTHAGNLWAANSSQDRKIFVCYPTRDTATTAFESAGYGRHELRQANLIHGLVGNRGEIEEGDLISDAEQSQEESDAFRIWEHARTYCTVDTVLGLLAQYRRSVLLAPCLSRSSFIFDEIHSYDDLLFEALVRFLRDFDAPCLLMTASLQTYRKNRLNEILPDLNLITDENREEESAERYRKVEPDDPIRYAAECYQKGLKVLVVVNTVDRAMRTADDLEDALEELTGRKIPVTCYHSRYPYYRREEIRTSLVGDERTVGLFSKNCPGPAIAVATQVAQISLDISCDLLVTELAPICDLIQRMGRLNRWLTQKGFFVFTQPEGHRPYEKKDIEESLAWYNALPEHVTQAILTETLAKQEGKTKFIKTRHNLLDNFNSCPGSIRDEQVGVDVIHESHEVQALRYPSLYMIRMNKPRGKDGKPLTGYESSNQIKHAFVVGNRHLEYKETRGARWKL